MRVRRRTGSPGPDPETSLHTAAARAGLALDPWQARAATNLDHLASVLAAPRPRRVGAGGVYLWGPVGRGKTWLLDAFFEAAPARGKVRVHFHAFFRDLHAAVRRNRSAGHAFDAAVQDLLDGCELVCLDELHVHDVGDAMLAARLLRRLFDQGITLACTSNYPPGGLLPNPLYHHLFAPTIDRLRDHVTVLELAGPTDYRSVAAGDDAGDGFRSGSLHWPDAPWRPEPGGLPAPTPDEAVLLEVGSRTVRALRAEGALAWFAFADLCEARTSTLDFLALADRFRAWVLSGVPRLATRSPDAQQRFVNLVDVLHDRDVRLTLICDVPPERLLAGPLRALDVDPRPAGSGSCGTDAGDEVTGGADRSARRRRRRTPLVPGSGPVRMLGRLSRPLDKAATGPVMMARCSRW